MRENDKPQNSIDIIVSVLLKKPRKMHPADTNVHHINRKKTDKNKPGAIKNSKNSLLIYCQDFLLFRSLKHPTVLHKFLFDYRTIFVVMLS